MQTTPDKAPVAPKAPSPQDKTASPQDKGAEPPAANRPAAGAATPKAGKSDAKTSAQPSSAQPSTIAPETNPKSAVPASAVSSARSRSASLFFVRIDDDGVIVRQEARRLIPASDSPLLDSLTALLKGPSEDEIRKKLISLVPQNTKLLSAQVRGSTAFLNFNEAFMYNHYGIEGYAGQLKQIVYTATAFPTVQDVQILIEGEKHDYLGGEGVYIGRPLSRNSF